MGVDIDIIVPEGFAPMSETVCSFARCPGNIMMSTKDLGFPRLDHCENNDQRIEALAALIIELNKGEDSIFNAEFWEKADQQWSNGKEWAKSCREASEILYALQRTWPDMTAEKWAARIDRERMLKDAERFYLLLKAGYDIEWSY